MTHKNPHNFQLLTGYCEFCRPSDNKTTKLDFTGVIPNIVFLYFLNGQDVSLLNYTGPPLFWMAFLLSEKYRHVKMFLKDPRVFT